MSLLLKIGACHSSDIDDIDDFDWVAYLAKVATNVKGPVVF